MSIREQEIRSLCVMIAASESLFQQVLVGLAHRGHKFFAVGFGYLRQGQVVRLHPGDGASLHFDNQDRRSRAILELRARGGTWTGERSFGTYHDGVTLSKRIWRGRGAR